ncbi:site-specific integrase [Christensenellaceae bacterium OttesenSCG-928-L17]|nr:site-specific integrase [Christensenellaceae bacterium OttesenSCG-928-L17]
MPRKRAAKGSGTLRKRADGRWEAKAPIGIDPGTGKTKYKHFYSHKEKEAAAWLRKTTSEVDEGVYTEPSRLALGAWMDIWLAEYCGHLKESTLGLYKLRVEKTIKPALGAVKLHSLNPATIQAFYNGLQRGEKPLAAKSIKNIHGVLHKALQQALALNYIRLNPSNACTLPRVGKPDIKPLMDDDMQRFIASIQGHRYERPLLVGMFTGIRQGELIGLTWDCVDFKKGLIYLHRQLQKIDGEYKFTTLKSNKTRTITPAQFVMDTLKEQRRIQNEWRLLAGPAWHDDDFVFTNELGEHMKKQTLYANFKQVVAGLGLPNARFHDLRHTYAVAALQSGDDVKTVQENLGHHTAAFTLDVYGHVTEQMKRESAARMDAFIRGIKSKHYD